MVLGVTKPKSIYIQFNSNIYLNMQAFWEPFKKNWRFSHKLDGVGPVDNRPSTDKVNNFV